MAELSRRDLLKLMGTTAGAGIVSACAPALLTPSPRLSPSLSPPVNPTQPPGPNPAACATPTPTPIPVPPPTPVATNIDVYAIYLQFRGLYLGNDQTGYGYATVTPLYGEFQDPLTVRMDIKCEPPWV